MPAKRRPIAACEGLHYLDVERMFYPVTGAGHKLRTPAWPKRDPHAEPRALCRGCPLLAECMLEALEKDGHSFRGGLSVDERAALGGVRQTGKRNVITLTAGQALARLKASGFNMAAVRAVIAEWERRTGRSLWVDVSQVPVDESAAATQPQRHTVTSSAA